MMILPSTDHFREHYSKCMYQINDKEIEIRVNDWLNRKVIISYLINSKSLTHKNDTAKSATSSKYRLFFNITTKLKRQPTFNNCQLKNI
mmetsp:Transcript_18876/g.38782  ORF Transcript_18876/g.38782 Transcript_18876/m.38782 type:complete len:89 (+) Transcript_18876:151-417(+)